MTPGPAVTAAPVTAGLALLNVDKAFDGFPALRDASFTAEPGAIHALLGENGAGKSTLMNVACGLYAPDAGRILVGGDEVRLTGPSDAAAQGIGMVHQHFKLVRPFTVAENVLLAGAGTVKGRRYREAIKVASDAVRRQAAALGFALDPSRRVDSLSVAEQQRVEVVRALVGGARILILDEPTAVLTDADAERLLHTLRELAGRGATVILITHKLADVKRFADRVTVMRGGRTVATVDPTDVTEAELTRLTVGDTAQADVGRRQAGGRRRLEVLDITCRRFDGSEALSGVGFAVKAGEIYGVAGVSGNGQAELAEVLMGLRPPDAGTVQFEDAGVGLQAPTPEGIRSLGAALIPADRYGLALAGGLSVVDNYAVGRIRSGRYGSWAWTRSGAMRKDAAEALESGDVQGVRTLTQKAALLSGGNAQKLVIAREFAAEPAVIVAQSPSRGLDARATAAVHRRLVEARARGAAVLVLSEDLDEVLKLSDRVGVMAGGRLVAEFEAPVDRQQVGRAMVAHV